MENYENKFILLDKHQAGEMTSELSYLRVILQTELKPLLSNVKDIDQNLKITIENFDASLAKKMDEVMSRINFESIKEDIVNEVLGKFDNNINEVDELAKLSVSTQSLILDFHKKYDEIEKVFDKYDKRISTTKFISKMISFLGLSIAFTIGGSFYPFLHWYFIKYLA